MDEITKEEINKRLDEFWEAGLRDQMGVPSNWLYRRWRLSHANWKRVFATAGEDQVKVVSGFQRKNFSELCIFISPIGVERLQALYSDQAESQG